MAKKTVSRRDFVKATALGGSAMVLAACAAPAAPEVVAPAATATPVPPQAAAPAATQAPQQAAATGTTPLPGKVIYSELYPTLPRGGDAHVGILAGNPASLHVLRETTQVTLQSADPVHDFLVHYDTTGTLVESLAESFEILDDLTHQYVLREGVTFHNGKTVTAVHVKECLDWVKDPANASAIAARFANVEAEVVDDRTVLFHLKAVNMGFRGNLTRLNIIDLSEPQETAPVGCGPFMFKQWEQQAFVEHTKYENYWNPDAPRLDSIKISTFPDPVAGSQAFLAGGLDGVLAVPAAARADYQARAANGEFNIIALPTSIAYLQMNHSRKPFDDVRVRQAMALSVNRQVVVDTVFGGLGEITYQTGVLPSSPYYFKDLEYPPDIPRAKALMAEAGFPDGFDLEIMTTGGFALDLAAVAQAQWAEIGIRAVVRADIDLATLVELAVNNSDFDVVASADGLDPEPSVQQDANLYSTGSSNWRKYINPASDALMDAGRTTTDVPTRTGIYKELAQLLYKDDIAIIPLATNVSLNAYRTANIDLWTQGALNARWHNQILAKL